MPGGGKGGGGVQMGWGVRESGMRGRRGRGRGVEEGAGVVMNNVVQSLVWRVGGQGVINKTLTLCWLPWPVMTSTKHQCWAFGAGVQMERRRKICFFFFFAFFFLDGGGGGGGG